MPLLICKKNWAAEVKRTQRTERDVVAEATLGFRWGEPGAKQAIELRLDILRRWPFVRTSFEKGSLPPPTNEKEALWGSYIARVEQEEANKEWHWVAPGESWDSPDGSVGRTT